MEVLTLLFSFARQESGLTGLSFDPPPMNFICGYTYPAIYICTEMLSHLIYASLRVQQQLANNKLYILCQSQLSIVRLETSS